LETLAFLGSISTGAIVHMFGASLTEEDRGGSNLLTYVSEWSSWWTLPVTILVSEHVFLALRAIVRFLLQGIGSDFIRREKENEINRRKRQWDLQVNVSKAQMESPLSDRKLKASIITDVRESEAFKTGVQLIEELKTVREKKS
jgi:anoctamin-10